MRPKTDKFPRWNLPRLMYLFLGMALAIAIFPMPYSYYTLLRIVVSISTAILTYQNFQFEDASQTIWPWGFALISVVFNPIIPIYLSKNMWMPIDIFVASVFIYLAFSTKKNHLVNALRRHGLIGLFECYPASTDLISL